MAENRPTTQEFIFLHKAYNCFFNSILPEVLEDSFWERDAYYRFSKVRDAFLIYSEILDYEPIGWFLERLKTFRPPMEAELSKEFVLFLRNVMVHFPLFNSWDEVEFSKDLINWSKPGQTIDRFLTKFSGHSEVKYRTWNYEKRTMTYVTIKFPVAYTDKTIVKFQDFMPEKEGVIFVLSLMKNVLESQLENERFPKDDPL